MADATQTNRFLLKPHKQTTTKRCSTLQTNLLIYVNDLRADDFNGKKYTHKDIPMSLFYIIHIHI